MDSVDQHVLNRLLTWLEAGKDGWLCTIVATYGSSPRPAGSLLACNTDGEIAGSLSGGCVEDDLIERIRQGDLVSNGPRIIEYGVSAEENERLGLPCGGRLEVLVESWQAIADNTRLLERIIARISARKCIRRTLNIATGHTEFKDADSYAQLRYEDGELMQCFGPRYQMLLVGAGQLSLCLAEIAMMMDYRVIVCDPRPHMIAEWSLAGVELLQQMPDDAIKQRASDPYSIIITLTHDPRIDDMALMYALTTDAFYVGALGSPKTTEKRLRRLRELDLAEEQIARLHAPVGLPIGSKTPAEIAVSILAELTKELAGARSNEENNAQQSSPQGA